MKDAQTYYLSLLGIGAIAVLFISVRTYRTVRIDRYRYRLYAIRDKLYMLVVEGKLPSDSEVFIQTCQIINGVIRQRAIFTPRNFVQFHLEAEIETFSKRKNFKRFASQVKQSPPEVQEVILEFFETSLDIMMENSLLLRFWLHIRSFVRSHRWTQELIRKRLEQPRVIRAYNLSESRARLLKPHDVQHAA